MPPFPEDSPPENGLPDLVANVELLETPRHGFQGDRGASTERPRFPLATTLAISRETGARGATIGRRVAKKLGWQVYDQELLEFMAQEGSAGQNTQEAPDDVAAWVEDRLQQLLREQSLSQHPSIISLARVILMLGAQGNAVLIGRGAGFLLPASHSLHVRVIAPLADRIAYLSQLMRLSVPDATEHIRQRDSRRAEFMSTHFHRQPDEIHQYDLLVNSSRLGEDETAELICQAVRGRIRTSGERD